MNSNVQATVQETEVCMTSDPNNGLTGDNIVQIVAICVGAATFVGSLVCVLVIPSKNKFDLSIPISQEKEIKGSVEPVEKPKS